MDINNKRILILGAYGQCGAAIAKLILRTARPEQMVLCSLYEHEANSILTQCEYWANEYQPGHNIEFVPLAGNILNSNSLEGLRRQLAKGEDVEEEFGQKYTNFIYREYNEFSHDEKQDFFLFRALEKYNPHILIDCVNTATGLAYQDIFSLGKGYLKHSAEGTEANDSKIPFCERVLMSAALPALVRHVEILNDGMHVAGTQLYLKVGTTGTGGMGLNIPYTHSESKPSRTLMSKSAVAGASSLLYLLMNRTQGNPVIKEIKPAALIGWKSIGYGEIRKHGRAIPLYDCPLSKGRPLSGITPEFNEPPAAEMGGNLQSVYIDTGENGVFTAAEFEAITTIEQMELVTPEDVARAAVEEIRGESTGFDIVGSLNAVCLDSSYRGGVMRGSALRQLSALEHEHGQEGVAFEILGPPRLSKLLWELFLIKKHGKLGQILASVFDYGISTLDRRLELFDRSFDPGAMCEQITTGLAEDANTRSRVISIGIPICTPDLRLLYGPTVALMRAYPGRQISELMEDPERRAYFLENGAVVLMPGNLERWKKRIALAIRYHYLSHEEGQVISSSAYDHRNLFTVLQDEGSGRVNNVVVHMGELIGWLFITEEHGSRRRHFFHPGLPEDQ